MAEQARWTADGVVVDLEGSRGRGSRREACRRGSTALAMVAASALVLAGVLPAAAQDVPGSKDPAGMKRYAGSDLIGYRAPRFDEYLLPLGPPKTMTPPAYAKSTPVEGLISYYTYMAPTGRTPAELYRNYKQEFLRLGIETMYEKGAGQRGWFGPTFNDIAAATGVAQILAYNEAEERLLVGRSKDASPTYYVVFVTAYKDGVVPARLHGKIEKGRALAQLVVVAPQEMESRMTFVNADDMRAALHDSGRVALYGVYFDSDKDVVGADSKPTLAEIAKLMKSDPALRLHVVGHTDDRGRPDYNVDLSRRRAANVVRALTGDYGIAESRLDSFGCGQYSPAATNETESGRAKNRRVELVKW
jgi:OOP family OmpA-OmpF porin